LLLPSSRYQTTAQSPPLSQTTRALSHERAPYGLALLFALTSAMSGGCSTRL
jgi:hypothetical protein